MNKNHTKLILMAAVLFMSVMYSCKKTTSDPDPTPTTNSNSSTNNHVKTGSWSFAGHEHSVYSDSIIFLPLNDFAAFSSGDHSAGITGDLNLNFRSSSATNLAGTFTVVKDTGTVASSAINVPAGFIEISASQIQNSTQLTSGYAVSGNVTVSVSNGATKFTFNNVVLNAAADGTGTNLGNLTGTFTNK